MNNTDTKFAPAERADEKSVSYDADLLCHAGLVDHLTYVIPTIMAILNKERQIVYANQRLMDFLEASTCLEVLGKRPGEVFGCIHAYENAAGCGTTEFCRECGAVKAILKSQRELVGVEEECRITTATGEAYEFKVWASPYTYSERDYTVFSLVDIRDEKRRDVLERTFFHDINNILFILDGNAELMGEAGSPEEISTSIGTIRRVIRELVWEIDSYRKLLRAEKGQLPLELVNGVSSISLLDELIHVSSEVWHENSVHRRQGCDDFVMTTDRTLLFRVLLNMVKNAVEASPPNGGVSVGCRKKGDFGIFSVHNKGFMPRPVQLQVFQRSFSTKGKGRGIGTYSMKLFGEKYLKGKVWFDTSEEKGTTFSISVPLSYKEDS